MRKFFKNTWFQIIFFGLLIGVVFILLDNKFKFFEKKERDTYKGVVEADKDKIYFTKAEYSEFEYDFGKVKEGDTVGHVFKIRNIGKEPLIIYKSQASCECIAAFASDKSIMPDSTGNINVFFKTKGRKGKQIRSVDIVTNTDPATATLMFKGEVE